METALADVWAQHIAPMAADPQLQHALQMIEDEFAITAEDGLEAVA